MIQRRFYDYDNTNANAAEALCVTMGCKTIDQETKKFLYSLLQITKQAE